jgi:hypothetical protein
MLGDNTHLFKPNMWAVQTLGQGHSKEVGAEHSPNSGNTPVQEPYLHIGVQF